MRAALVFVVMFGAASAVQPASEIVSFPSGNLRLKGMLFKPDGAGPFPAVVYNHGSAAGMLSQDAFNALGPVFVRHRWVFFGPYRRGQGLSAQAGPYIGDEIEKAKRQGGMSAGAATMTRLLETDHLDDQLAGLAWLRQQAFVDMKRIAVAGNSFGGIETVLGAERANYCGRNRLGRRRGTASRIKTATRSATSVPPCGRAMSFNSSIGTAGSTTQLRVRLNQRGGALLCSASPRQRPEPGRRGSTAGTGTRRRTACSRLWCCRDS